MMAHHHKLAGHPGITQMRATLQEIYYWHQMAADIFILSIIVPRVRIIGVVCACELAHYKFCGV